MRTWLLANQHGRVSPGYKVSLEEQLMETMTHSLYLMNEGSCTHTVEDIVPWWIVDLKSTYMISAVQITNVGSTSYCKSYCKAFTYFGGGMAC